MTSGISASRLCETVLLRASTRPSSTSSSIGPVSIDSHTRSSGAPPPAETKPPPQPPMPTPGPDLRTSRENSHVRRRGQRGRAAASSAAIVSMNVASSARVTPRDTVSQSKPRWLRARKMPRATGAWLSIRPSSVIRRSASDSAENSVRLAVRAATWASSLIEDLDVARMIGRVEPAARHRALQIAEERLGAERRAHDTSRRPPRTVLHSPAAERCQARAAAWPWRSGLAASACTMTCDTRRGPALKM